MDTSAAKTITPRTNDYKRNANVIGWHIHTESYVGYNNVLTMDAIVRQFAEIEYRLVTITGNVLMFAH